MSKEIKIINEVKAQGNNIVIDWADDIFNQFLKADDDIAEAFKNVARAISKLADVTVRNKK